MKVKSSLVAAFDLGLKGWSSSLSFVCYDRQPSCQGLRRRLSSRYERIARFDSEYMGESCKFYDFFVISKLVTEYKQLDRGGENLQ